MAALPVGITLQERLRLYAKLHLYRERMQLLFGCLPLATLGVRYDLTFGYAYTTCVQPIFHCHQCPFWWAMELCLSNIACIAPDFQLLMGPLESHELACSGNDAMARAAARGILAERNFLAAASDLLQRGTFEHAGCLPMHLNSPPIEEHCCSFEILNWMASKIYRWWSKWHFGTICIPSITNAWLLCHLPDIEWIFNYFFPLFQNAPTAFGIAWNLSSDFNVLLGTPAWPGEGDVWPLGSF